MRTQQNQKKNECIQMKKKTLLVIVLEVVQIVGFVFIPYCMSFVLEKMVTIKPKHIQSFTDRWVLGLALIAAFAFFGVMLLMISPVNPAWIRANKRLADMLLGGNNR